MILFYEITFSGDNNVFDKDIISKVMSFIEIKQFFIFAKYWYKKLCIDFVLHSRKRVLATL